MTNNAINSRSLLYDLINERLRDEISKRERTVTMMIYMLYYVSYVLYVKLAMKNSNFLLVHYLY